MSDNETISITRSELKACVQEAVREELARVGLYPDDREHSQKVQDDLRFAGNLRAMVEGAASKVGMVILLALAGGFIWIVQLGVKAALRVAS